MALSLDELINPESADEALTYYLTELATYGFPTTAWQTGSVVYTILRAVSLTTSDKVKLIAAIAKGVLLDLSSGDWLTLLAKSHYDLTRYAATFATHRVAVTIAPTSPGQTIQPGQLWLKTGSGKRFNSANTSPVVIAAGATVLIDFKAESPGSSYNVALGTGLTFVTTLPGMTAALSDVGDGSSLVVQGADDESDAALKLRCRTRWATIGIQKTKDAYVFLATNTPGLSTQPNRVKVDDTNPRGPNTVDIWLAGPAGPLPAPDEAAIEAYILARKATTADVQVSNAATLGVTVVATVEYQGAYSSALAQAADNVTAYLLSRPLGAQINLAEVIEHLQTPDGVVDCHPSTVTLNGVNGDLTLAANQVAVVTAINLTGVVVNDE